MFLRKKKQKKNNNQPTNQNATTEERVFAISFIPTGGNSFNSFCVWFKNVVVVAERSMVLTLIERAETIL